MKYDDAGTVAEALARPHPGDTPPKVDCFGQRADAYRFGATQQERMRFLLDTIAQSDGIEIEASDALEVLEHYGMIITTHGSGSIDCALYATREAMESALTKLRDAQGSVVRS